MTWHIEEGGQAPQRYAAVYFIYLPTSNKCLYANDVNNYTSPMTSYGDITQLQNNNGSSPLIPIDPHLALSCGWLDINEMAEEMPYINDSIKACLRLVKDIKEETSGNDKEGL